MGTLIAIISFAVFGLIVGAIARALVPGRQNLSLTMTMVLGVIGSLAGGLITWLLMGAHDDPYQPAGWIMSIVGAIVVVWLYAASMDRRRHI